jgi:chemotaxis protein CheX
MTAAAVAPAPSFTADDVRAVTGDVWEACLAFHGEPLTEGTGRPFVGEVERALVRITGDWCGAVTLEMSSDAATTAARLMLEADDVDADEVADAVGELVNIIGGNIKSLLPTPSRLSLPQVTRGEALLALPGSPAAEHCRVDLSWGIRPVLVRVWS